MKMQLAEIARALGVEANDAWQDVFVTNICFDSRQVKPGALFVPLMGANDGHNYVQSAIDGGAVATLWQADHVDQQIADFPSLVVENCLEALQTLSKYYLVKINPKVVAVTGSNGKTTTKDMTAAVLGQVFNVHKTQDNFNNEIGVPMTILSMEPNTEILVVELGMDRYEQLDFLSKLVEPDVAIITMIGEAHIEFFGSRDNIAEAKFEITHGLKEDGVLVINGNEPLLTKRASELQQDTITFGSGDNVELQAMNIVSDDKQTSFRVKKWPEVNFTIPMIGSYNVYNALSALAVGDIYHIPVDQMKNALADFSLTKNRTEWLHAPNGARILSDVYNSNPTAVKEVVTAFAEVPTTGRRMIVLGDMLELGEQAQEMHEQLADSIDETKISDVYLVGPLMAALGKKLQSKFDNTKLHLYQPDELSRLTDDLKASLTSEDVVMLKASHGIHLEEVLRNLV